MDLKSVPFQCTSTQQEHGIYSSALVPLVRCFAMSSVNIILYDVVRFSCLRFQWISITFTTLVFRNETIWKYILLLFYDSSKYFRTHVKSQDAHRQHNPQSVISQIKFKSMLHIEAVYFLKHSDLVHTCQIQTPKQQTFHSMKSLNNGLLYGTIYHVTKSESRK